MELKLLISLLFALAVSEGMSGRNEKASFEQERFHSAVIMESSMVRPLADQRQPLNVSVDFTLSTVTRLNKASGYAEVEGFLTLIYNDPRYSHSWVSQDTVIRVNPMDIWTPDIDLFNSVHPGVQTINLRSTAVIYASGDVTITNKVHTRTLCDVRGQHPVKGVNCTLKFGSWAYSGDDIMVGMKNGPDQVLSTYKVASVWNVTKATAWTGADIYPCCVELYPWVQFSFLMKKRRN